MKRFLGPDSIRLFVIGPVNKLKALKPIASLSSRDIFKKCCKKVALGRYIWCSTFSKESLVFNVQQIHALLLVWSTVKGAKKRSSPHEIIQGDQLSNRKLFALLGPFIVVVALVIQNFASSFFPWVTWYARIDRAEGENSKLEIMVSQCM